ncbi:ankyrin repeat protein [Plakobranchus ocellatus]|uniref:Ankyrin repeat protein n=1 Tax=Plakobranchus ocellatus TaxID=259542 RepID=A0AAV4BQD1_9GAST|nr:ankyrin repeat protein [Plakobranchus ocellatus]
MEDMALELVDVINGGHEDLAREILLQGNYGNINSLPPNRPGAALFCCCIRGYLSLAELLLKLQADVDLRNENMATPLHGAVDNGHQDLVKLLLDHNADVNAQTRRGDTPLHLAAYRGFMHISQCLILARADVTLVNHNSMTPKMEAAAQGHKRLADYIGAVYEVLYPEGYLSDKTCLDSLIHLDPPSQVVISGRDHHKEQQYQARLQAEQQTKLQGELTSRLQPAQGTSLRTLQGYAQGHPFAGQPLLEQESIVCNSSSDFGFPLGRLEAGAWTTTPGSSSLHHRQPQQQDESDLCSFQDVHRCLVQRQQLQHKQQQQQLHSRQACGDRIELSPKQPSSAHTNQHPLSFHHHFHQQQSHPRDHVSFMPIGPGLHADPRSTHQYSTGRLVGYEDLAQSAMAPAINELDRKSTCLRVPTLNVNDLSQQNVHILQPAMKFTGRWSASIDTPASSFGDLSSDSGTGASVNSLLSNFGNGSDFRSLSLNERGETQDPLVRTLIPLHNSFLSSLSPVPQSPGGHGVNKVSRSKSLTSHPVQWSEAKQCSGKPGERGQDRSGKAKSASALDMNEDILRNFVPAGPPPLPVTQELRDTLCPICQQPLRSGGLTCYGSDTSISGPQPSMKTRLARSESSSPSVGVEGFLPVPINYCLDHENTPAKQRRLTYKPQPDSAPCAGTIANQFDGKVHRRGSLDDDIFKSNVRSIGFYRRLSLAGDSTGEHNNNNVGACVPYRSIVNNSASHDRRIPCVCRNYSLESDYSSGGISLISTTSDMNSLAPSTNSLCDSGTSFGSNAGDGSLTSCHDLPLVAASAIAPADPEDNTTNTDLLPTRPLLSAQPRHNSFPSDRSLATETNNNSKTSNSCLLNLNDLSAASSSHEHQPSESPKSPMIHESHRSLPPLMTYINIPIN